MLEQLQQNHREAVEAALAAERAQREREAALAAMHAKAAELDAKIAGATDDLSGTDPFGTDFARKAQAREQSKIVLAALREQCAAAEAEIAKGAKQLEELRRLAVNAEHAVALQLWQSARAEVQELVVSIARSTLAPKLAELARLAAAAEELRNSDKHWIYRQALPQAWCGTALLQTEASNPDAPLFWESLRRAYADQVAPELAARAEAERQEQQRRGLAELAAKLKQDEEVAAEQERELAAFNARRAAFRSNEGRAA